MITDIKPNLILLITIEGLDGTFKNTNTNNLINYLNSKFEKYLSKIDIKSVSFPRYDKESGYFPKVYLDGKYSDFLNNLSKTINDESVTKDTRKVFLEKELDIISDFYLLDMFDWNNSIEINKPTIIVFDRYFYSMMYYLTKNIHKYNYSNIDYMKEFSDKVLDKVINKYNLEKSDILIKLYNSNKNNNKSIIKNRNKNSKDIYENDFDYLTKVAKYYTRFDPQYAVSDKYSAVRFGGNSNTIITIDVYNKDQDEILNEIVKNIMPILSRYKSRLSTYFRYNN